MDEVYSQGLAGQKFVQLIIVFSSDEESQLTGLPQCRHVLCARLLLEWAAALTALGGFCWAGVVRAVEVIVDAAAVCESCITFISFV